MFAISFSKVSEPKVRTLRLWRRFRTLATLGCVVASGLSQAQYSIVTRADGWSQAWYNGPAHTGAYTHLASFGSPTASVTPGDLIGDATAATSTVAGNGAGYPHNPNTFGRLSATADLSSISTFSTEYDTGSDGFYTGNDGGTTRASMDDTLTFNVGGANGATQTVIGFTYTMSGHLDQSGSNATADGEALGTWSLGNFGVSGLADVKLDSTSNYQAFVNGTQGNFDVRTTNLLVQTGTFTITGPSASCAFHLDMAMWANSGMDESFASSLRFTMPSNVSIGSSSGVFGSAVPEPCSVITMMLGLGALVRRKRRA